MDYFFRPDFPGQTAQEHFEAWSLAQEAAQAVKAARIKSLKKWAPHIAVGVALTAFAGIAAHRCWSDPIDMLRAGQ